MSIWFYLFLIVLCLSIFLILKIIIMKNEINNIGKSISSIINADTNNLITISTNDASLKRLASVLNKSLKNLRKLELEYENGNGELKSSITNISHDLRTPLTAIRGYLDLMDNNICKDKVVRLLNENMLKRVFENIISNAIKYGERDFKVKMFENGTIEFSNKTDKLDQVSLEKIFDRYYTVRNAKKSSGVGLSIAKQLVILMGGKIEATYTNKYLSIKISFK